MKPRIFVSTVTSEFRTARTKIEHVLEFLGYEVVQQDIFGVEPGDLRQVLREKIDSCDALIQLVGDAYGAEPPVPDEEFGRVSYTQFEFFHAQKMGKKTYVLFAGSGCKKDTPTERLDPANHAELRDLQAAYRDSLRSGGHLWHHPADDTALENSVLKLRNDSEQLRKEFLCWQKDITKSQARISRLLIVLSILIVILGIGGFLLYPPNQGILRNVPTEPTRDQARHALLNDINQIASDAISKLNPVEDWQEIRAIETQRDINIAGIERSLDQIESTREAGEASDIYLIAGNIFKSKGSAEALSYLESNAADRERKIATAIALRDREVTDLRKLLREKLLKATALIQQFRYEEAEKIHLEVIASDEYWLQARHEYIVYLIWIKGSRQQTYETLSAALATYREAERQSRLLTLRDPGIMEWQRDLSVSHNKIGEVAVALGDLTVAEKAYTASMEITAKLIASDPDNTEWQRGLSISHSYLGDVAVAQGDLPTAAKEYTVSMEIAKALSARDPDNTQWQRDLSICYEMLGDVALAQGNLSAGAKAYTSSMEIAKALAALDPENTRWQWDLSISHQNLGDIAEARADIPAAANSYQASYEIIKALADRDPDNTQWQRDLSISHENLGDVSMARGDLPAAVSSYIARHDIIKAIAARDPDRAFLKSPFANF